MNPGTSSETDFEITEAYHSFLKDDNLTMPIAAVLALTELIRHSEAETMYELVTELRAGASTLQRETPNAISLTAGTDLFLRYVTTARLEHTVFALQKAELVKFGAGYATELVTTCRERIATLALGFIPDEAVILTHSYSRVVMQALRYAHKRRRISVFVTEARPRGLGVKTYEALTAAGIPCTIVLDTAVAYVMDKADLVLVGSEAVVESGGLINAVGSYQMAIVAKALNKPVYALAESYKFLRSFPLSQYDLPAPNKSVLQIPTQRPTQPRVSRPKEAASDIASAQTRADGAKSSLAGNTTTSTTLAASSLPTLTMTEEQIANNPEIDYTRPDLIANLVSDVGILTPSAVSQFLVETFAG